MSVLLCPIDSIRLSSRKGMRVSTMSETGAFDEAWSMLKAPAYLSDTSQVRPLSVAEDLAAADFRGEAGKRPEFLRMPGEGHGPNDRFFREGEVRYVPRGHNPTPASRRSYQKNFIAARPHPYSRLGADVMEGYQLMQEEPEGSQLLTPDELEFAQMIAENDGRMPPASRMAAPTLRQGMDQYNPPIRTSHQVPMRDAWSVLKMGPMMGGGAQMPKEDNGVEDYSHKDLDPEALIDFLVETLKMPYRDAKALTMSHKTKEMVEANHRKGKMAAQNQSGEAPMQGGY